MKKSKFTEEQIVRILQEAASGQKTNAQTGGPDKIVMRDTDTIRGLVWIVSG